MVTEEDVRAESSSKQPADNNDEFSSLQLQGGDITRGIYRYVEGNDPNKTLTRGRSKSFRLPRPENEEGDDISAMKVPQGFRRNFVRQKVSSPHPNASAGSSSDPNGQPQQPRLFTQSFFEFLSLYGHFAGEELEEEDESEDWSDTSRVREGDDEEEPDETSGLIPRAQPPKVHKKKKPLVREGGSLNAALLLLKGFVGTGVLFLPKAFSNGGMAFSTLVLLFVAALSYYCFVLLVKTRLKVPGSFGGLFSLSCPFRSFQLTLSSQTLEVQFTDLKCALPFSFPSSYRKSDSPRPTLSLPRPTCKHSSRLSPATT